MNIADKIEATLADILPVYGTTPEFGASEPEEYAVYNISENGAEYGDGVDFATEYYVILSVFTPNPIFVKTMANMPAISDFIKTWDITLK